MNSNSCPNKGAEYEQKAAHHLMTHGLELVCRNYHCRQGEIDLILRQDKMLVFVEVRYRQNRRHGGALASVTPQKQQKIRLTAQHYLAAQQLNESRQACRFDVVAFEDDEVLWLPNAF